MNDYYEEHYKFTASKIKTSIFIIYTLNSSITKLSFSHTNESLSITTVYTNTHILKFLLRLLNHTINWLKVLKNNFIIEIFILINRYNLEIVVNC